MEFKRNYRGQGIGGGRPRAGVAQDKFTITLSKITTQEIKDLAESYNMTRAAMTSQLVRLALEQELVKPLKPQRGDV